MKKLLSLISLVGLCMGTGLHNSVLAMLGIGSARYAISKDDPLGKPSALQHYWSSVGVQGELGKVNSPRTMAFRSDYDAKHDPDFQGGISVTVGDEEYVQKIAGVFVGSQHGYSPQRPTQVEQEMGALWTAVGGSRPSFHKVSDGKIDLPYFRTQSGNRMVIPMSHMEATFSTDTVTGRWLYSESNPMEVIELSLK